MGGNVGIYERFTVAFVFDWGMGAILLLKRAGTKSFAPNEWTGIGGHIEAHEDHQSAAARELWEETRPHVRTRLAEFARCIVRDPQGRMKVIYYFWGKVNSSRAPASSEGTLRWIKITKIFHPRRKIIETTHTVMKEWKARNFRIDLPFTVMLTRADVDDTSSRHLMAEVIEGLQDP